MSASQAGGDNHLRQLTPLLVWAVVFCDIGTSVYYVPGILYERVGNVAPIFVWIGLLGFVLLAAKYVEICWRKPDGGGVVNIAGEAFTPMIGALGGVLILVGYFMTSAISSVSGMHYLGTIVPAVEHNIVLWSVAALLLLAVVNFIGIRESAALSLVMAAAAIVVNLIVVVVTLLSAPDFHLPALQQNLALAKDLDLSTFLVGFSGAWLAFSGLESISQLSPAMKLPIKLSAKKGMRLVIVTMIATSPVLTLLAISLVPNEVKDLNSERFVSELGGQFGGGWLKLSVVLTASSLLLFAANTAIIGSYHVFIALAEQGFMPTAVAARNRWFGTPTVGILLSTLIPIAVVLLAEGNMLLLGGLYAFGLLGAFLLSSAGLDVLRWRDGRRDWLFWSGVFTSVLVLIAWLVTMKVEGLATLLGVALVLVGVVAAVGTRRKWFSDLFYALPFVRRAMPERIHDVEEVIEADEKSDILSLSQAESLVSLYPGSTMVAVRGANAELIGEAINREKGFGGKALYVLYVEERTGLFVGGGDEFQPKPEGVQALKAAAAAAAAADKDFMVVPVWTVSYNAVEGIARAAETLGVNAIMIGVSQRNSIWHLLRGHVLAGLTKRLPPGIRLLIYG
jgi:amino acid transporter/nucleotide-binding universal stress UspA family protein